MEERTRAGHRALIAATIGSIVVFAVLLRLPILTPFVLRAIDDVAQSVSAFVGAACCGYRARRTVGRWRVSWGLLAGACLAWGLGEMVWSYYEVIAHRETPFPSFADLGFILFPALALPGLLVRPSAVLAGRGRARVLLDGMMVTASLFNLTWMTALGQVYHAGGTAFDFAVSVTYPTSDLIMVTIAMILLAHARIRKGLPLLLLGLVVLAIADSSFLYFDAVGVDPTGSIDDVGWFASFLFMALAALRADAVDGPEAVLKVESTRLLLVPYACVGLAGVAEAVLIARGRADAVTLFVAAGAIVALLVRQLLTVLDNRRLVIDVMSQQAELAHRAFHDSLTGLANRALFHDRVVHALDLHRRDDRPIAVLYCDLDGFKTVNDSLGHDAGDALLQAVARRMEQVTRPGDTLARLGGDEFAILIEDGGDVQTLSARLLQALSEPVELNGRTVPVPASIGTVALATGDECPSADELIKRADLAMYAAKHSGRGTAVPFAASLLGSADDLDERLALAEAIRTATVRPAFQPIDFARGGSYGFEALARWRHDGVDVSPAHFIPLAERAGVLGDLDLLMTRLALARLSDLDAHGNSQVSMTVNLGASVLHRPDLAQRIAMLLQERRIDPRRLVAEVSETDALGDHRTREALAALREVGLRIAIDDFGIGYSNFSRLGELAPEVVKLDMSLVRPLDDPTTSPRLVAAVISMAHDLGAFVVGEGVETERALTVLRDLGCDAVQGFHIGRPAFAPGDAAGLRRTAGQLSAGRAAHSLDDEFRDLLAT